MCPLVRLTGVSSSIGRVSIGRREACRGGPCFGRQLLCLWASAAAVHRRRLTRKDKAHTQTQLGYNCDIYLFFNRNENAPGSGKIAGLRAISRGTLIP